MAASLKQAIVDRTSNQAGKAPIPSDVNNGVLFYAERAEDVARSLRISSAPMNSSSEPAIKNE
jgi:hypothetical protein